MEMAKGAGISEIRCRACGSGAIYRYGKIKSGKQRFMCLICGRQFILDSVRSEIANKPLCPVCGRHMNLYKREKGIVRFRCSGYPECSIYQKVIMRGEGNEALHSHRAG